jgi:hypothetical protein
MDAYLSTKGGAFNGRRFSLNGDDGAAGLHLQEGLATA